MLGWENRHKICFLTQLVQCLILAATLSLMPVTAKDKTAKIHNNGYRHGDLFLKTHLVEYGINSFTVYRSNRVILHKTLRRDFSDGGYMYLCLPYYAKRPKVVRTFDGDQEDFIAKGSRTSKSPFVDFDGDGVPDIAVSHNYFNTSERYNIFSLGVRPKEIAKLETVRHDAKFVDVDHDGVCEILVRDTTFFGWKTCNACSPMPLVVLKMQAGKPRMMTSIMKTQPPSREKQKQMFKSWKQTSEDWDADHSKIKKDDKNTLYFPPKAWGNMFELILSGNSKLAFNMLKEYWPDESCAINFEYKENVDEVRTSRETFENLFLKQLKNSPYIQEIKKLNSDDKRITSLR